MNSVKSPKSLVEAVKYFDDPKTAHQFFVDTRWPDQVCCPRCGSVNVKYLGDKYWRWECKEKHEKRQFTVKVGSVMEDSALSLKNWAVAFWLESNCRNSISSIELSNALGITQKSAWFMQQRIRLAMQDNSGEKLSGVVEADESFVGGKTTNMHAKKRRKLIKEKGINGNKTIVMGVLARDGNVRTEVIADPTNKSIHGVIRKHVEPDSMLMTDDFKGYRTLRDDYVHSYVKHSCEEYVIGDVHTNGIEGFWSQLKRAIKGSHIHVSREHLFRYADAQSFRYNTRKMKDGDRMPIAVEGANGKRLTYNELIGKDQKPS